MKKVTIKELVLCAMFAAVCCAVAPISIPMPGGVPITLQTAAVFLCALCLGPKLGFMAVLIYVLLGAVGLPVFAGLSGGMSALVGAAGGFIWVWPFTALLSGFIYFKFGRDRRGMRKYVVMFAAMLLGSVLMYAVGLSQFMIVTNTGLIYAMTVCMIVFIPGDIIKMVLVAVLTPQIEKALKKTYAMNEASANA